MSTEVDRTIENEVEEDATSEDLLANLSEEQTNLVQLDKIHELTVREGVMRLPVHLVTTAENSDQWVVEVEHPVEGTYRLYFEAPMKGWTDDNELVQLLGWYGVRRNPYELQVREIYVAYRPDQTTQAHGWIAVPPPGWEDSVKHRLRQHLGRFRINRTPLKVWTFVGFGTLGFVAVMSWLNYTASTDPSGLAAPLGYVFGYVLTTMIALMIFDPEAEV